MEISLLKKLINKIIAAQTANLGLLELNQNENVNIVS